nr:TonB-dependent receptor [uncultured Roseateles sp.]
MYPLRARPKARIRIVGRMGSTSWVPPQSSLTARTTIGIFFALANTGSALGNSAPKENPPIEGPAPLARVEITGTAPHSSAQASFSVIDRHELEKFGASTIIDVLRLSPLVTIGKLPSQEVEIRIGGLGGGYTQVLLNGAPLPKGFSIETLPPGAVERIEISRMPRSDRSNEAIAGSINIVLRTINGTKKSVKQKIGLDRKNSPTAESSASYSGSSGMISYSIISTILAEDLQGTAWASEYTQEYQEPPAIQGEFFQDLRSRRYSLHVIPTLRIQPDNNLRVTLQTLARHSSTKELTLEAASNLLAMPFAFSSSAFSNSWTSSQVRPELTIVRKLANGAQVEFKQVLGHNERRAIGRIDAASPNNYLERDVSNNYTQNTSTSDLKYAYQLADRRVSLGVSTSSERRHDERYQRESVGIGSPINSGQVVTSSVGKIGSYIQGEFQIGAKISGYAGIRYETVRLSSEDLTQSSFTKASISSPTAQVVWSIDGSKDFQLSAAISRTYRVPKPENITSKRTWTVRNSSGEPDIAGNPQLIPELAWALDTSLIKNFKKGTEGSVTLGYRQIANPIVNITTFDGMRWVSRPENRSHAELLSLSSAVKFPLSLGWACSNDIATSLGHARNWSQIKEWSSPGGLQNQSPQVSTITLDCIDKGGRGEYGLTFRHQATSIYRQSDYIVKETGFSRGLDVYYVTNLTKSVKFRLVGSGLFGSPEKSRTITQMDSRLRLSTILYSTPFAISGMVEMSL